MKSPVFVLTGPTGVGKTLVALELAEHFSFEIIGADSLQIFRHLDVGTAKPSVELRKNIPHHLIDALDPDEEANAFWYAREAQALVREIHARKKFPLVVGGAGFYLRALEHPPVAPPHHTIEIESLAEAHARIQLEDPESAARIHPNDRYRISRAISLLTAGQKPSEIWKETLEQESPFDFVWLGIQMDRPLLYEAINTRLDEMFASGLLDETDRVRRTYPKALPRLQKAIGYRQALGILTNEIPLARGIEVAKQASRNYAKRQLTWLRRDPRIQWVPRGGAVTKMIESIQRALPA